MKFSLIQADGRSSSCLWKTGEVLEDLGDDGSGSYYIILNGVVPWLG